MAGESIGNAYINVVPKVDGDAKALGSKFGSQVSSGANSAVSAGTVALGNILADAVMQAANAAAEAFKQAFTNIMDYEQLAGGAQKIFDEIDYSTIAKDAQNAYKELNMSANEYLASINMAGAAFASTMGDAKGYQVAREGMLAISDYATGTGRSIDELNQKYQMITRSSASYQSIADQFAGILPATSADFLAQAQAAGYLSTEYKKLTDVPVAEYQEAVTKMLTKGVDDLGLAANTLHESESTMSGSLAMLSSSWANFLTALGGGEGWDMASVTDDLIQSLGAVAANILPALQRIGQSIAIELPKIIADGLSNLVPVVRQGLVDAFGENAGEVFDNFVTYVNQAFSNVQGAIDFILGVVQAAWPTVQGVLGPIIELVLNLAGVVGNVLAEIGGVVSSVLNGVVLPLLQQVFSFCETYIVPAIDVIRQAIELAFPIIQNTIVSALETVQNIFNTCWPAIVEVVTTAASTLMSVLESAWSAIVSGINAAWSAVESVTSTVWSVIQNIVSTAVGAIQAVISTITNVVGVVSSAFNAVRDAIQNPIEAAKNIVRSAIDAISNIISGAHLQLPDIKLPHFNIDGGQVPWGIGGEGYPPSISIDWYAHGGIVDGAQLIGAGEAGPEMILPQHGGLMAEFAREVSSQVNRGGGANQTYNIYANDPLLVAEVVASKQRRALA